MELVGILRDQLGTLRTPCFFQGSLGSAQNNVLFSLLKDVQTTWTVSVMCFN